MIDFQNQTAQLGLVIPQYGRFRFVVNVVGGPPDLTGYTGSMQIRDAKADAEPLATVDPSNITVNATTRQVVVDVLAAVTATYDWSSEAVYDLYIENGADRWRLCEGRIRLSKSVTREF